MTALLIATHTASVELRLSATPVLVNAAPRVPTPKAISVAIVGGNLFVYHGPSLYHNYVGALYDEEAVFATGRDRISRWMRIEFPDQSGREGWITTETKNTQINGDVVNLPYVETEPAEPAFIRNYTKTTIGIYPEVVQLPGEFNAPYDEEQFIVGRYRVLDLDYPGTAWLVDIDLSEGERVDIRFDGAGEKCE